MSDPYLMMAAAPALVAVARMVERMQDVALVEEGKSEPRVEALVEVVDMGVTLPGLSPVEIIRERYSVHVNSKPVVAMEVKSMMVDTKLHDLEVTCSWHPQVEVEMAALLKRLHVPMLAMLFAVGTGLSPQVEQLPGLLMVHLGQRKAKGKAAVMAPFMPAEAASEPPSKSPMPLYAGHHSDGYYVHPAPVAACDDDDPSFDAPGACQKCDRFVLCHPHVAEAEAEHVEAFHRAA
jgi:hypothetical protein